MNDVILILQMKQGDEQAFDKFVRKYYGDILSYCKYHCLDQTEAEDLTQETFLRFMIIYNPISILEKQRIIFM